MTDPQLPDISDRENLIVHIEGLQATLTKRNARIAQLEAQLAGEGESERFRRLAAREYRRGWVECAGRLMEVTRKAALNLSEVRSEAFKQYLAGDRLPDA